MGVNIKCSFLHLRSQREEHLMHYVHILHLHVYYAMCYQIYMGKTLLSQCRKIISDTQPLAAGILYYEEYV